ncbi:MAG: hypothetical protein ABR541_04185, partial [Candidatus Dormibacteria bacterium]
MLDAAFTLYRSNFRLIVIIAATVEVPYALVTLLLHATVYRAFHLNDLFGGSLNSQLVPSQFAQDVDLGRVVLLAALTMALFVVQQFALRPLGTAATARAVSDRYLDRQTSVSASYRAALHRLVTLAGIAGLLILAIIAPTAMATVLAIAISPLFLIVAVPMTLVIALYATVWFALTPQIVMLEGRRALPALGRSRQLVSGS